MSGLSHIWFDVDGTLYRQNSELEARIFNEMYREVSRLLKIKNIEEVRRLYDVLYKDTESHTATFERLGLPADVARKAYNFDNRRDDTGRQITLADYVSEDSKLVKMFEFFDMLKLPYSVYSNNYARTVEAVLAKLGLEKSSVSRFVFKISGESFPKNPHYMTGGIGTDKLVAPKTASEKDKEQKQKVSGFERILELSRVHAGRDIGPDQIMFVGDREKIDIRPAKKYGMSTARVLWTPNVDSVKSDADYKLADIYELSSIVESLAR